MSDEVIEIISLSSDDDEIDEIVESNKLSSSDDDTQSTVGSAINGILEKYKKATENIEPQFKTIRSSSSSSSSEDEIDLVLKNKYNSNSYDLSQSQEQEIETFIDLDEPQQKKKKHNDKTQKQQEKEQEKQRKQAEREKKKLEVAVAKAEKRKLASTYKSLKPEECIKLISAHIDSDIMHQECSTDIPITLQNANISYRIESNLIPLSVTWTRKIQTQLVNNNGVLEIDESTKDCDEVLIVMLWNEFVKLVYDHALTNNMEYKKELLNKKIFLAIYGIENYFRFHKKEKQKVSAKEKIYADSEKVSRKDVDMALIEIQLMFKISHRFLETPQDLSTIILQFSKSIAQIPYKLQKEQKEKEMDWYVSGDKKDSVKVNKNGNGLHRLWQQQITQFNLVKFEIAEAITSKYSSPTALIRAYEECSTEEGEKLLQDIPIRRAAGPLTSARKIGPELSKKLYILFSSIDGDTVL